MDNGTGTLTGRIVDALTKKPIAQVVVTFTSPALVGELEAISDDSGDYTCGDLPLGVYTLRAEAFTYEADTRGHVTLDTSTAPVRVNLEMVPA